MTFTRTGVRAPGPEGTALVQCKAQSRTLVAILPNLQELVSTFQKQGSIAAKVEDDEAPAVDLPESLQTNREAYAQGEWRKYPYAARCPLHQTDL